MNLTDMLGVRAEADANGIATFYLDRSFTWQQTKSLVSRLAGGLIGLGAGQDDRIAILALNSDRYTQCYWAVWWAGAVIVPMNTRWSATENAFSLNDAQAEVLIIDRHFVQMLPELVSAVPCLKTVVFIDGDVPELPIKTMVFEELAMSESITDLRRSDQDLAGLYYTGGTTGFPKGVMLSHRALWYNAIIASKYFELKQGDVYLHAAPMFHLADGAGGGGASMSGATHVYLASFSPEAFMEVVEQKKVTHAILVPTMVSMLLSDPAFDKARLVTLQKLIYGASPMPEGVLRQR